VVSTSVGTISKGFIEAWGENPVASVITLEVRSIGGGEASRYSFGGICISEEKLPPNLVSSN
jgi:hypothetical protein